jgi:hypothetical protein
LHPKDLRARTRFGAEAINGGNGTIAGWAVGSFAHAKPTELPVQQSTEISPHVRAGAQPQHCAGLAMAYEVVE